MKQATHTLAETENSCPLHMSVVPGLKPATSAKRVSINVADVKTALTEKTASKGIIVKHQWKNVTKRCLWQRHF